MLIQYLFPVQRVYLSLHFFLSGNFKIFTATNVNNWVASNTLHWFSIIYYFFLKPSFSRSRRSVIFRLSFEISSGYYLLLTKFSVFLNSTCLLLAIFLKIWRLSAVSFGPKLLLFYFKNIWMFIQKKGLEKIPVPEFQKYKKK